MQKQGIGCENVITAPRFGYAELTWHSEKFK